MIAPIPQSIKDSNNEQQENQIPDKIYSFADILQENDEDDDEGEEQKRQPIIFKEERVKLVQENTKRIYASKEEDGRSSARVLDCITRQLFYEKQCVDQNEYDFITTNILNLYEKLGADLDDLVNIVKDVDDEKLRIYYENGVINFRQLCDYNLKQKQYWFNQQGQLKSIFKQTFLILHQLFENSFYFGNLSMESISFCKQKGGNKGLVVKLMDIGYGSFEYNEIIKGQLRNKNSIEIQKEEDRRIFELQILGYLFEEIMLESVVEYENSLLSVFSEIGQKPENCPLIPDIYQQPAEKIKKISQYYQKDILQALKAIREGVDYAEIFQSVVDGILLEVDEQTEDINVYDQENQFQRNLQEKVSEIEKDINNKEEFLAYLQILKALDMWKLGVKILKQNQEKYPYKENLNILYESLYFYRMAGEDCTCLGESAQSFVEDYKKEKDDYFRIMIFCVFCENDPEKYADIHQESVDHFQLADDPPSFAWIQYMLGQIYYIKKKEDFAFSFLEKASQLYDTINIEDDEKGQCYELYQQYIIKPQKRLNVLNKAYQFFQNKKLYEGQRYGDLMESYGDTYKQMGIAKTQEQQQQAEDQEGQDEQQQELQSPQQQPDIVDIDYETMYDFYLISHTVYEFSLGKNNEHALRLHNKICNTAKFFQDLTLYVSHTIDYILLDEQEPDPQVISELTSLVVDQEFLLACLKSNILDKAELYERSHRYQEAQKLIEGCQTILQTFENDLLQQVQYKLEIIRLKHMYYETNKEFLLTEGFEKALNIQDKNYFFKRWNINLIVKGELKQSLKSIETNQPECEDNIIDQAEFFILRTAIFKKMEKFDKAEDHILKAQIIVEDNDIYYLSQFVKDQIHYIQFLAQEQLENRLEYNQKKYKKMLKQKSCQEQEILRLQMNCAFIHELQSNYKQSRDIVTQVLDQSHTQHNNKVQKSAKTTLNRLYEKKLMAQLEKQQRYQRPSTAFI